MLKPLDKKQVGVAEFLRRVKEPDEKEPDEKEPDEKEPDEKEPDEKEPDEWKRIKLFQVRPIKRKDFYYGKI